MSLQDVNISINAKSLLLDEFDTIKKYNPLNYTVGNSYNIVYKQKEVGIAELVACRDFFFHQIRDELSLRMMGKAAPYLAGTLTHMYGQNKPLPRDFKLAHLVFKFRHRKTSVTKDLVEELIAHLNTQAQYN